MDAPDLSPLDRHFIALIRAGDYDGAVRFFKERVREAFQGADKEAMLDATPLLITSLSAAGPDEEAISLLWQVIDSLPEEPFIRSSFAELLLYTLREPAEALKMLDSVFDELVAEVGSRHAALAVRGEILFALERTEEAGQCFRDMIQPSLRRMDPSAFDFRLVESLISGGLMKEECMQYLNIAYHQAKQANDEGVMERVDYLRGLLQQ